MRSESPSTPIPAQPQGALQRGWRDARAVFSQPGRAGAAAIGAQLAGVHAAIARWTALDDRALLAQGAASRAALTRATHLGGHDIGAHRAAALGLIAVAAARYLDAAPGEAQLFAALAMHEGFAVDLPAGGGKTLAVACCAILHAWSGMPCHVIAASERLAQRDAQAMARLFAMTDCSVGWLGAETPRERLAELHACDVLYATGRQLVADHVRERAAPGAAQDLLQRQPWRMAHGAGGHAGVAPQLRAAVVDDIDRVLLDEALTPLVISAGGDDAILDAASRAAVALADALEAGRDYTIDFVPMADIAFTEAGRARVDALRAQLPPFWRSEARCDELLSNALIARDVLHEERHYALREGRIMPLADNLQTLLGARGWYAGILQALEARAGVEITPPPRTIARTALQEFFPLYRRLGGAGALLGGLAPELWRFYRLRTLAAPGAQDRRRGERRRSERRQGGERRAWRRAVYGTRRDKVEALVAQAERLRQQGLPVLICTADSADLETVAAVMGEARMTAQVAVGLDPEQDALRLAQAGQPGALTLATVAVLRGTPIPVSDAVRAAGGLQVLMSGHQESRRLDLLMSGEADARHGERRAQVYVSLEDDMFARSLPFWAAPLHRLAQWPAARTRLVPWLTPWLVRVAQAHVRRQLMRHRLLLLKREQQLDQQLAFSRRG